VTVTTQFLHLIWIVATISKTGESLVSFSTVIQTSTSKITKFIHKRVRVIVVIKPDFSFTFDYFDESDSLCVIYLSLVFRIRLNCHYISSIIIQIELGRYQLFPFNRMRKSSKWFLRQLHLFIILSKQ
jgi:hypothetical protein